LWSPYKIGTPPRVRPLQTVEGLGDRIRLIAFAERQAQIAFLEASTKYQDIPAGLAEAWIWVAAEEKKHESWLLQRLNELNQAVDAVDVSLSLYHSFSKCESARDFAFYIADAEERGRVGAERFAEVLRLRDPQTAEMFAKIALEEREHIALVAKYFPS
jgi:uncharacterized ferritin-like protein (DUF455 family)